MNTAVPLPATTAVVVGVDDTPAGWAALAWAEQEFISYADPMRPGQMVLCRTHPPAVAGAPLPQTPDMPRIALVDPEFARAIRQVRTRLDVTDIEVVMCTGDPATELVRLGSGGCMIVLPAPPHGPALAIATSVAAHADGTVVAVRPTHPPAGVTGGPFAGHVLVGVDGEGPSRRAVRFAFEYAGRHNKPIAAIHAGDPDPSGVWVDDQFMEAHFVTHAFGLDLVEAAVHDAHLDHPDVPIRRMVLPERPEIALVNASAGAALLVVGDRGRGSLTRRVLGSVSRHVVRNAHCSVAVVHDEGGWS